MARWSRGQDAALSRRKHGFDSRTSCYSFRIAQPMKNAGNIKFPAFFISYGSGVFNFS